MNHAPSRGSEALRSRAHRVPLAHAVCALLLFFAPSASLGGEPREISVSLQIHEMRLEPAFRRSNKRIEPFDESAAIVVGDFNGDDAADIAGLSAGAGVVRLRFGSEDRTFASQSWRIENADDADWQTAVTGDFDNDGASDLAACGGTCETLVFAFARRGSFRTVRVNPDPPIEPAAPLPSSLIAEHHYGAGKDRVLFLRPGQGWTYAVAADPDTGAYQRDEIFSVSDWQLVGVEPLHRGRKPIVIGFAKDNYYLFRRRKLWAAIPRRASWDITLFGDLNGDQLVDMLAFGRGIEGTWAILTGESTGIELAITSAPQLLGNDGARPHVGDFNGDGLSDILIAKRGGVALYEALPGPAAAADVSLTDHAEPATTDESGSIRLTVEPRAAAVRISSRRDGTTTARTISASQIRSGRRLTLHIPPREEFYDPGSNIRWGREPNGPFVCTAYNPYGLETRWGRMRGTCAKGYAALEVDDDSDGSLLCCRLPASDILTSEHIWTDADMCPPDMIVTGGVEFKGTLVPRLRRQIRCTRIDASRYTLGKPVPGTYWGIGTSSTASHLSRSANSMPVAIRGGVGRGDFGVWDSDGCIGSPPGAILVSNRADSCDETRFAVLLRRETNDRHATTPVQMFPSCLRPPNVFNPLSGCELVPDETGSRRGEGE